ncbi:MAG: hypothetical protein C4332_14975 [Meiothermus sp.]
MMVLEYLTQHRLAHAQRLLATTDQPVLEIAFEAGFGSSSRFYAVFEEKVGSHPWLTGKVCASSGSKEVFIQKGVAEFALWVVGLEQLAELG